jgi:hypothetical protein
MTGRLFAGLLLALLPAPARADDPKLPTAAEFDKLVVDALRDVHNRGADLYNTTRDFEGAYRLYQGGLVAVRPLLAHRPEAQKLISDGLAAADQESSAARRAFKLHETIEAVRKHLKDAGRASAKGPNLKKETEGAPMPKEKVKGKEPGTPPKKGSAAVGLAGKVTFRGKPLAAAEVALVSLDLPEPRVFTAKTGEDGSYTITEALPPSRYVVTVAAKDVPEKYKTTTTSGLVLDVKTGANAGDLNLQ